MPVSAYHHCEKGQAYMDIRLLSLLPVQYQRSKEMAIAESLSFFNVMCILAGTTLIDHSIQWLESRENKVKAAFSANGISIAA